ncbi:MAG: hypothetical protein PHC34_06990 [Candidatus Gastranaerophilales bacterium]|nr:hypothetical protein [Candidatus Gastranaerophilales bacterium]
MNKINFQGNLLLTAKNKADLNNNKNTVSLEQNLSLGILKSGTINYQAYLKSINPANTVSFEGKKYNGYELAISEKELDNIIQNQSTIYELNPVKEYEALQDGDKRALKHLVRAAKILNDVFLKQDHQLNIVMKKALEREVEKGDIHAQKALKLFNTFNGIEGENGLQQEPVKIFDGLKLSDGRNMYPQNYNKEKLINYLTANIEQTPAILNNDTIVKAHKNRLYAVPYSIEFRKEYEKAAKELLLAAKETTHKGFSDYLQLQTQALVCNDPEYSFKADEAWANLKDSPLEFTISRESYKDSLAGAAAEDKEFANLASKNSFTIKSKDFIGVRVGIVDQKSSKNLADYKKYLKELTELMPLKEEYPKRATDKENKIKQNLSDVDLVYMSGDYLANRPSIVIAQNLPNNDKLSVKLNAGRKNVFHKQIRKTENPELRKKKLEGIVDASQRHLYNKDSQHLFVIGHELSHALGPNSTRSGKDKKSSLGEGYGDVIEESKADLGSIMSVEFFVKKGKYTKEQAEKIYLTFAADLIPLSNPPLNQPHRVRSVMQFNYFVEKGAIELVDGKIKIVPEKFNRTAKNMLEEEIKIQLDGDSEKAKEFVDKYRQWNDNLEIISRFIRSLSPKPYCVVNTPLAEKLLTE